MGNIKTLKPFQKGEDPRRNTKGRPKILGSFRERLREEVNNTKIIVNGEETDLDTALIMRVISDARAGKNWAIKFLFDYLYGKPKAMCPGCRQRQDDEYEAYKNARRIEKKEIDVEAMFNKYAKEILLEKPKNKLAAERAAKLRDFMKRHLPEELKKIDAKKRKRSK